MTKGGGGGEIRPQWYLFQLGGMGVEKGPASFRLEALTSFKSKIYHF